MLKIPSSTLRTAAKETTKSNMGSRMAALSMDKRMLSVRGRANNTRILGNNSMMSIHAENYLLARVREPIHTMIIARTTKDGRFGNSRPCPKCSRLIRMARIKFVVFFENGMWIRERVLP